MWLWPSSEKVRACMYVRSSNSCYIVCVCCEWECKYVCVFCYPPFFHSSLSCFTPSPSNISFPGHSLSFPPLYCLSLPSLYCHSFSSSIAIHFSSLYCLSLPSAILFPFLASSPFSTPLHSIFSSHCLSLASLCCRNCSAPLRAHHARDQSPPHRVW